MTITSSGAKCDVCGDYILPIMGDELVHTFRVTGIVQVLHCCEKCKKLVKEIGKKWWKLPQGPLRKVFEEREMEGNDG